MPYNIFASTEEAVASSSPLDALGVNGKTFLVQLLTFIIVFFILKKFAFGPIVAALEKRRQTLEDGVRLGQKLEKERDELGKEVAATIRDARHEADKIIAAAHKEGREVLREAEKTAQHKSNVVLEEAQVRIEHEAQAAKRKLEKEIVTLVAEATEAVVGQKIDMKKDASIIEAAVKGRL
jgi:F-type H+-transporting ATPase subunit b